MPTFFLETSYDPLLVAFSFVLSIVAAYTALDLAGRVSQENASHGRGWLWAGAVTMGLGIWAMHFVGMTALHTPMRIRFDVALTAVSLLCSIAGSAIALSVVSRPRLGWGALLAGALLMANTLGAMHYLGMFAMRTTEAYILWHPMWIVASVGVALAACVVALTLSFRLKGESLAVWSGRKLGSAVVMGTAIAGMHYTGMQASSFVAAVCAPPSWPTIGLSQVGVMAIGFATLFVLVSSLIATYKDHLLRNERDMGATKALNLALEEANAALAQRSEQLHAQQAELQGLYETLKRHSDAVEREVAARTGELQALNSELQRSNERLVQADRYKDEFLSVLSHELRTPLNAILGFASILDDQIAGPLNTDQHNHLGKILLGADRMLLLVEDLLDIARIQAGKVVMTQAPADYGALVASVLATMEALAERKGLTLRTELAPSVGTVCLDGGRISQVLTNLVGNALKFTPPGGTITVRATMAGDELVTEVADTGAGIAPEDSQRVFEKFQQLDMSKTREAGGTGLGLAISKALVEAHGGAIGVESRLGAGATFWFRLPDAAVAAPAEV